MRMYKRKGKITALLLALILCAALLPLQALALEMQAGVPFLQLTWSTVGFAGQEWHVIGYNGNGVYSQPGTVTLLVKGGNPHGNTFFRARRDADPGDGTTWTEWGGSYYEGTFVTNPNEYKDSTLQRRIAAIADGLPARERELINARTLRAANDGIRR